MSLEKIGILGMIGAMVMITIMVSGCLSSSTNDTGEKELLTKGNSWTYKAVDAESGNGYVKMTVISEGDLYKGNKVIKIDLEYGFDAFYNADSEMYYDDWTGSATIYYRMTDFEVVFNDYEWEIRGREDPGDDWSTSRWEGEATYTTTGTIPDEIKEGVSYSLEETTADHYKIFSHGTLIMDSDSDDTLTKNYEVLGQKEVTVPAGTFTCFEIRVDTVGEDSYTLKYFSPELRIDVKIMEYRDTEVTSTHELESYSI
jgi:hypothetical protein